MSRVPASAARPSIAKPPAVVQSGAPVNAMARWPVEVCEYVNRDANMPTPGVPPGKSVPALLTLARRRLPADPADFLKVAPELTLTRGRAPPAQVRLASERRSNVVPGSTFRVPAEAPSMSPLPLHTPLPARLSVISLSRLGALPSMTSVAPAETLVAPGPNSWPPIQVKE